MYSYTDFIYFRFQQLKVVWMYQVERKYSFYMQKSTVSIIYAFCFSCFITYIQKAKSWEVLEFNGLLLKSITDSQAEKTVANNL